MALGFVSSLGLVEQRWFSVIHAVIYNTVSILLATGRAYVMEPMAEQINRVVINTVMLPIKQFVYACGCTAWRSFAAGIRRENFSKNWAFSTVRIQIGLKLQ